MTLRRYNIKDNGEPYEAKDGEWVDADDALARLQSLEQELEGVRTPRFYGVRKCEKCGAEQIQHPAGYFSDDELKGPCYD